MAVRRNIRDWRKDYANATGFQDSLENDVYDYLSGRGKSASGGWLSNAFRKWTGSGLTSAQIQQNEANAAAARAADIRAEGMAVSAWQRGEISADNAMERQRELRTTQYQDMIDGATAAGINPYFAISGGAIGPTNSAPQASAPAASAHASSGASPQSASLSDLAGLLRLKTELDVMRSEREVNRAEAENIRVDSDKKEAETANINKQTEWMDREKEAQVEAQKASANLDRNRVSEIYANIRKAEAQTQDALAGAILKRANAWNITELTPYMQLELKARSESERANAQQFAVAAAYQQGLIDNGMIEATIRETNANASVQEVERSLREYTDALNRGDESVIFGRDPGPGDKVVVALYKGLRDVSRSVLGK